MILSVNGISFAYRGVPVLEDVTFSWPKGRWRRCWVPTAREKRPC